MTPSHIGRYEIQRRLGRGGMGSLFLGYDPKLKRPVAIKLLNEDVRDDRELRERFAREAESVARLRHPNIVIVFDVGEDETGHPFMAMEYIAGETLKRILEPPSIPLPKRLAFMEDLCAGLAHAHAAEIVHRDIKPENIMFDGDGVLKILDFGIARQANSGMTQDGMMLGTYNYMSPEQMVGSPVDQRSDIFAVGAVLYEVVSLRKAFPGAFPEAYHRILTAGPLPLEEVAPHIDPDLARVVYRALERKPEKRYQHISALRQDLMNVRRRLAAPLQESGERPAYDATQIVRGKTERPDTRRQGDNKRLAEVRRQQIEEHLRLAQAALEHGDHALVLQHAERAASVDPDNRVAFELIDKARLALDTRAVLKLLREASQLQADGRFDEAEDLARQASSMVPDLAGAEGLRQEAQDVLHAISEAADREGRIQTSLRRARDLLDKSGFETALRAIYEVLALDPDRQEARALEQSAKEGLNAQRERERVTREAYDRLNSARTLAEEGKFDEAMRTIADVTPTSITVRHAAEQAIADVKRLRHEAAIVAAVSAASDALSSGDPDGAIARIDAIAADDQSEQSRSVRAAAVAELERRRELAQRKQALEDAIAAARACIADGDLTRAQLRVDAAVSIGLDDDRLHAVRREVAQLKAAAEARRREQERLAREEAERRAREEADRRAHEEAERQAREEGELRAREEAERRAREESDRRAREEAERRAREEADRRAREDAERRTREESDRRAREEGERRNKEDARRKEEEARRREEESRQEQARRQQEQDRRKQEEERQRQEGEARKRAELETARKRDEQRREEQRREEQGREERRREEERRAEEQRRRREEEERAAGEAGLTQIVTHVRAKPVTEDAPTIARPVEPTPALEELPAVTEIRTPRPVPPPLTPAGRPQSKTLIAAAAALVVVGGALGTYYLLRSPDVGIEVELTTSVPALSTVPPTVPVTSAPVTSINGVSTALTSAPTTIPARPTTQSTIAAQLSTIVSSAPATVTPTITPTTAPVTSALTSAPTSAVTTSIPVRVQTDPKDLVSQSLGQYASAYTQRDFQALRRVWPAAPQAVSSTFSSVQRYELVLEGCDIRILSADRAEARCVARTTVVPERGNQTQRSSAARVITLRLRDNVWIIESVAAG